MPSPADDAVREFLAASMVAQVATLSAAGRPFVTPLWFVVDDGTLYLTTGPGTRVGRNVDRQPAVTLLLRGERLRQQERMLRLHGTATCHRGLPSWRVLLRIAAKYYVSPAALAVELPNAARWRLRVLYYQQLKGGVGHLRIVPRSAEFLRRP
jgi:nitroimidazol reductase NimA-like FMN-containing flavoprotein (pyridoxamine 5'-phosphate oxidase superfamily)